MLHRLLLYQESQQACFRPDRYVMFRHGWHGSLEKGRGRIYNCESVTEICKICKKSRNHLSSFLNPYHVIISFVTQLVFTSSAIADAAGSQFIEPAYRVSVTGKENLNAHYLLLSYVVASLQETFQLNRTWVLYAHAVQYTTYG